MLGGFISMTSSWVAHKHHKLQYNCATLRVKTPSVAAMCIYCVLCFNSLRENSQEHTLLFNGCSYCRRHMQFIQCYILFRNQLDNPSHPLDKLPPIYPYNICVVQPTMTPLPTPKVGDEMHI